MKHKSSLGMGMSVTVGATTPTSDMSVAAADETTELAILTTCRFNHLKYSIHFIFNQSH